MKPIWRSTSIHLQTKLRLFNTNIKTVLLYGSETWKFTKELESKLQVFVNTCLRQILRIRWPEKISNEDLWQRTKQEPITQTIKTRKWRWIGHTLRRGPGNIAKQALDWTPQGKRRVGRPTTTWRRTLEKELKGGRMSWGEAKRKAQNRLEWRRVVKALCSTGDEED